MDEARKLALLRDGLVESFLLPSGKFYPWKPEHVKEAFEKCEVWRDINPHRGCLNMGLLMCDAVEDYWHRIAKKEAEKYELEDFS